MSRLKRKAKITGAFALSVMMAAILRSASVLKSSSITVLNAELQAM
jgi:hypothetical protein